MSCHNDANSLSLDMLSMLISLDRGFMFSSMCRRRTALVFNLKGSANMLTARTPQWTFSRPSLVIMQTLKIFIFSARYYLHKIFYSLPY